MRCLWNYFSICKLLLQYSIESCRDLNLVLGTYYFVFIIIKRHKYRIKHANPTKCVYFHIWFVDSHACKVNKYNCCCKITVLPPPPHCGKTILNKYISQGGCSSINKIKAYIPSEGSHKSPKFLTSNFSTHFQNH